MLLEKPRIPTWGPRMDPYRLSYPEVPVSHTYPEPSSQAQSPWLPGSSHEERSRALWTVIRSGRLGEAALLLFLQHGSGLSF
jgi:hypothetical protein